MAFQQSLAPILRLPNELLQPILEDVCQNSYYSGKDQDLEIVVSLREAHSLSLVCKRFNDLALPILYRDPCGRCVLKLNDTKKQKLTRTLEMRSDLCAMVTKLILNWGEEDPPELLSDAFLFFGKLTNVKKYRSSETSSRREFTLLFFSVFCGCPTSKSFIYTACGALNRLSTSFSTVLHYRL